MYHTFYHLKKEPFHITPDPEFLFLSPTHKEALACLHYGLRMRKGFIVLTGEVGVGKTTIIRSFLKHADRERVKVIYLFNAMISFKSLLQSICTELEIPISIKKTTEQLNRLYERLLKEYQQGNAVLLIVDEAQNMPVQTLEYLRMLSNFETTEDKLLQIVLAGQPEFEKKLSLPELRQLKQRIAIQSKILPLTEKESFEYVRHRLAKAAVEELSIFSPGALKRIVREARGIPRILNILCDNALITGYGYQQKEIHPKIVEEVISDFETRDRAPLSKQIFAPLTVVFPMMALRLINAILKQMAHELVRDKKTSLWKRMVSGLMFLPPLAGLSLLSVFLSAYQWLFLSRLEKSGPPSTGEKEWRSDRSFSKGAG
jgi:general secretion pathway protein A